MRLQGAMEIEEGKKKEGSMSSVESKPDRNLKKKREKGNERKNFSTRYNGSRKIL